MTLPPHPTPASSAGLTTAAPRREYWFGLPALRTSARAARDAVRHRLSAWQVTGTTCSDAVLLVSELTTNAVLHTDSERVLCGLMLSGGEQRLRIELHDAGRTPIRPPEHQADACAESGRGLFLVQELADRWGSAHSTRAEGTVVWAELTACP
ncbi:ATP-binding protein [Streptomyces sp. NPDC050439]|uniref:ATP-binding protein n=1 Tax=unclassified Streptomyces TaxID=2593676 RepID=UPI003420C422